MADAGSTSEDESYFSPPPPSEYLDHFFCIIIVIEQVDKREILGVVNYLYTSDYLY